MNPADVTAMPTSSSSRLQPENRSLTHDDRDNRKDEERRTYPEITMALCENIERIYDVDTVDDSYLEFNRHGHGDALNPDRRKTDFFATFKASLSQAVHSDDLASLADFMDKESLNRALQSGETVSRECRLRIDGKDVHYRLRAVRPRDDDRRLIVAVEDIEEEVRLRRSRQLQLEEALQMAQAANRAKTAFLNNMSHDIRTPMNAIIGFTGLASTHIDNKAQVRKYLEKIGQSSNHLLSLINDVLDMSRIESGKMNLNERKESLAEILHTLRDIIQADVNAKQLDLYIDTVDVTDETIVCDKLRLNQVLLNIISNAVKFTRPRGTISMRILQKPASTQGYSTFEFRIRDTGIGMSPETIATLFEPFTREPSAMVSGIQGTGLGMAITKSIVDMMGGKLDVSSTPNEGTEFVLTLDFRLASKQTAESIKIPALGGLRGLVVDDDCNTCLSISQMLRDVGMRPEWCVSGKEAIVRTTEAMQIGDLYRLYIIDWLMPDMNGIETTRRIRRIVGEKAPIIILTAYDWSDIEEEARDAGVTGFVSKPLFPSDLRNVLLQQSSSREEAPKDSETVSHSLAGKRVLLVEDNELNREIAIALLMEHGIEVDAADDGSTALEKLRGSQGTGYDLILMDVQMPVMDGYEATRQIRALPNPKVASLPIIAMTANAFDEDRRMALAAGMNEHIPKPIKEETLLKTLGKYFVNH